MKKKLFLAIALLSVAVSAQTITGSSRDYDITLEKTFDMKPGATLDIHNLRADIEIRPWDKDQVRVEQECTLDVLTREEAEKIAEGIEKSFQHDEKQLVISGLDTYLEENTLRLTLPRTMHVDLNLQEGDVNISGLAGVLRLHTMRGDVDLKDLSGEVKIQLSAGDLDIKETTGPVVAHINGGDVVLKNLYGKNQIKTAGGDMSAQGIHGSTELRTAGGDIRLADISKQISAQTAGGDISAERCSENCSFKTAGGDIRLQDMSGPVSAITSGGEITGDRLSKEINAETPGGEIRLYQVESGVKGRTIGGDILVENTLKDFSTAYATALETLGGSITIVLPLDMPATIEAEIQVDRDANRYDIYSDYPLSKESPKAPADKIIRSRAELNGGGEKIHLKANGGNIHINKPKSK